MEKNKEENIVSAEEVTVRSQAVPCPVLYHFRPPYICTCLSPAASPLLGSQNSPPWPVASCVLRTVILRARALCANNPIPPMLNFLNIFS